MCYLRLPQTNCDALEQNVRKFYLDGSQMDMKIHWISWDVLCKRKFEGGLGLRNLSIFNKSLLAKHG